MIQHNVGYTGKGPVPRDRNGWQGGRFAQLHIDGDKSLDAALEENLGIAVQELGIVPVHHGEKEVVLLPEILLDAADYERSIRVSNFLNDHTDGVGALLAQGLREEIRPVLQLPRRLENTILGVLRNGARRRSIVQNRRDRAGSQADVLGDCFKSDSRRFLGPGLPILHAALVSCSRPSTQAVRIATAVEFYTKAKK